ncbi:hypothetical protein ABIA33_006834 [Streptacidiphilus sp. MAP12-16]|uniref:hypothetical protein n=1 Tax=Streptacidiphilus sp. MAP12-16 TaxID=3156300 RepID=UPI0035139BAB
MSDTQHHHAHVVVHPVVDASPPFRRVEILGTQVGKAYSLVDVVEFCRRAGIEDLDVETSGNVLWIGGGPHQWEAE